MNMNTHNCYNCLFGGDGEELNDFGYCWKHNGEVDYHQPPRDKGCEEWLEKLRSCPFCGTMPKLEQSNRWPDGSDEAVVGYTFCCNNTDCLIYHADNQWYSTLEEAAKAWNHRQHGKWEEVEVEHRRGVNIASMRCSKCRRYHSEVYIYGDPTENVNFCNFCGTDMRG